MRPSLLLGTAGVLAAVPLLALAALAAFGAAAPGPIALAALAVVVAALGLAWLWGRDLDLLAETLRHAAREEQAALAQTAAAPLLPPVERITRGVLRLSRAVAAHAAETAALVRGNEEIIEGLPDPLLLLRPDRSVQRANAAAHAVFGGEIAAVLRHPGLREAIDRAWRDHSPQTADLSLAAPVPREVHATVTLLEGPEPLALLILSDRTRERAVERTRADFVANASHELRTPLASLKGFIDTLRGPAADDLPAQRRFLAIMAEQAERMNRLIDDLLSLSRIELLEHQPPSGTVDLADLTRRILEGFEPRLAARHITLTLNVSPGLPTITADSDQLAQVLTNLVDNAVKYGRDGGEVRIALGPPPQGEGWPTRPGLVLTVADDGPGIPRAHLPRLTERFYRVDAGRSRSAGGTGLGLAIVKHIINRHRGQIQITSEEGRGARFSVWLPEGQA